ncbi:hypothetical protein EFBL_1971 [Effusibacillus lacus]|uniref:Uncharacterized protein n=1 Tax=Effusibacillus lacus TaxID=1348429 RepID=A0A292YPC5_9BACL|nr:hypothetical protein EFBL_1971 [Effusibacillus lacus]
MANLIQKFFGGTKGGSKDNCCGVEIKEVNEEQTNDDCCGTSDTSDSCCGTGSGSNSCCR